MNIINEIIDKNRNYGKNNIGNNKKINIEYASANPTNILDIGYLRGAIYGDCLSRIMAFSGFDVTRECYLSNEDNQTNEDIGYFKQQELYNLSNQLKKDLDLYRINFDVFSNQQELYNSHIIEETINKLKYSEYCYIKDGELWLKTTEYGDKKDRLLIKEDGSYTYFISIISYHLDKIKRDFKELIDILDENYQEYIDGIKATIAIINKDINILDIKTSKKINLVKDGEEIVINKKTGKIFTIIDLIEEFDINVIRYFITSCSLDHNIDLNMNLALNQTYKNPYYYIEQVNIKICSILKKYKKNIIKHEKYITLISNEAYTILNKLTDFKDVVISASIKKKPNIIAKYAYDLSSLFYDYYEKEQIITDDELTTSERINLIVAIQIVIQNALDLLGIIPKEEM